MARGFASTANAGYAVMTSTERYKRDDDYRHASIEAVRKRHVADSQSPNYRALVSARKLRWQIKESLAADRIRIKLKQVRLNRIAFEIEKLELAWGAERAKRKRAAIECRV
jgi:hypothetical protein